MLDKDDTGIWSGLNYLRLMSIVCVLGMLERLSDSINKNVLHGGMPVG